MLFFTRILHKYNDTYDIKLFVDSCYTKLRTTHASATATPGFYVEIQLVDSLQTHSQQHFIRLLIIVSSPWKSTERALPYTADSRGSPPPTSGSLPRGAHAARQLSSRCLHVENSTNASPTRSHVAMTFVERHADLYSPVYPRSAR